MKQAQALSAHRPNVQVQRATAFDLRVLTKPAHLTYSDGLTGIREVDRPRIEHYRASHRRFVEPITLG